jgi:predicted transcriptional regulator of viral defense system
MRPSRSAQQVVRLAKQKGLLRVRDVQTHGVHPEYLRRLAARGELTRVGRGLYALADAQITEYHSLAEVAARVPDGVVCLLTALRVHGLGTQNPKHVWLAVDRKAALPRLRYPPVRIVRFNKPAMTQGVEERRIEGVPVRLTIPARTVVDCFKYRNKIGLGVALEALRAFRRRKDFNVDQIWRYAMLQRVARVMKPYLEALA